MDSTVVDIRDAVVSYREDIGLRGASLRIVGGEFLGIIGPNGAGKTTLLTVINGLGKLVYGHAVVLGLQVNRTNGNRLRRQVGYVAQVHLIDPKLPISVRETVMSGCYGYLGLAHRPGKEQWRSVERALDIVGIAHLARRPIGHLSGGEYQRAAIARALVQRPKIFLLDEPLASIDPQAQAEILSLIELIHREYHMTTLYVTHDLSMVPAACQRMVLMRGGRIWKQGSPESVLREEVLSQLYGPEFTVATDAAMVAP